MYKLMVLHWSIFTLSTQLILCASIYSNSDSTFTDEQQQLVIKSEIFCNQEQEKTLPENGVESSLMLDLHPGRTLTSCKRFFRAPESHGFFIRLHKPIQSYGINNNSNSSSTNGTKKLQSTSKDVANKSPFNSTDYCPISITSLEDDQQPPWRFDPCQLELNGGVEEPVRILQGRLRILWVHGGNNPNYKLSLTVLGKGEPCRDKSKHPCLKFGDEPLLCISQDLICDGVRQCPIGGEMFSDEDDQLCENQRGDLHLLQRPTIWQHLTLGIFQNIFGPMESTSAITSMNPVRNNSLDIRPTVPTNPFTDMKTMESERNANSNTNNNQNINDNNNNNQNNNGEQSKTKTTEAPNNLKFVKSTRKITSRSSLSRYGSWGYMMLGMLMCSVVLLMCGIWECIRRVQKNDVMDAFNAAGEQIDSIPPNVHDEDENCPQYDPPPPYSSLFPLAKDFNSTTNSDTATNSIYFTSASASYGPSAPPSPPSIDTVLPQNSSNSQRININDRNNIENNDNQTNA